MGNAKPLFWLILSILAAMPSAAGARSDDTVEGILVGRISHVEGQLLRYIPEEKEWVTVVKEAPFGFNDALYSNEGGKAEFLMPNGTWARISSNTQIQLIALEKDLTEVDIASGVARLYNKSRDTYIKAITPFGYVIGPPGSSFDLYVGDKSLEVVALKESVNFFPESGEAKYEVKSGSSSILSDGRQAASGEGDVDHDWDSWNDERDHLWAKRPETDDSSKHLPEPLDDEAYTLNENGRWEKVEYDDGEYYFWRPLNIDPDWAPFTVGRWTDWNGDIVWVPNEPFGYVTHHYGNWLFIDGYWYWAPPRSAAVLGISRGRETAIGSSWYPGRVAWIHSGRNIGWVPLAPDEPYFCTHPWGPRAVVVPRNGKTNGHININGYKHLNHAVIVNRDLFYTANNYKPVRLQDMNNTSLASYRALPVLKESIIGTHNSPSRKHFYTNATADKRPHSMVVDRIERNRTIARQAQHVKARDIRAHLANATHGRLTNANVPLPKTLDKPVRQRENEKGISKLQQQQRQLKKTGWNEEGEIAGRRLQQPEIRHNGIDAAVLGIQKGPGHRGTGGEEPIIQSPRVRTKLTVDQSHQPGRHGVSKVRDEGSIKAPRSLDDSRNRPRPVVPSQPPANRQERVIGSHGVQDSERGGISQRTMQKRIQPASQSPRPRESWQKMKERTEQKRRLIDTHHQSRPRINEQRHYVTPQQPSSRHIQRQAPAQVRPHPPERSNLVPPRQAQPRHSEQRQPARQNWAPRQQAKTPRGAVQPPHRGLPKPERSSVQQRPKRDTHTLQSRLNSR